MKRLSTNNKRKVRFIMRYVNEEDARSFIKNEFYRRRNERYELLSFDEVRDLVRDAIEFADSVWVDE